MHYYVRPYYIPGNNNLKTKSFFTLKWVPLAVFCLLKLGLHLCWNCIAANGNGSIIKWHSKNAAIISEFGIITARLAWLKVKRDQNRNFFFMEGITFMQILVQTQCRRLIKETINISVLESFSHKLSAKFSKMTATK